MEKLLCGSTESRRLYHQQKNVHLLTGSFFIFSLAVGLLVSYIAMDHMWEMNILEENIVRIEAQIKKLKEENLVSSVDRGNVKEEESVRKGMEKIIEEKRKCHRTLSILKLMDKITSRKNLTDQKHFGVWNQIPKGSLHLEAKNASTRSGQNEGIVKDMKTVTGWGILDGDKNGNTRTCENVDPALKENEVVIPVDGHYVVYSQITLPRPESGTRIHRHAVQYVETVGKFRDDPKLLMENSYQMVNSSDEDYQVSYQKGIYRFTSGDLLRVVVSMEDIEHEHPAYFGVYQL